MSFHRWMPVPGTDTHQHLRGCMPKLCCGAACIRWMLLEPAPVNIATVAALREGVLKLIVNDSHWATGCDPQQKRLVSPVAGFQRIRNLTKIPAGTTPLVNKDIRLTK